MVKKGTFESANTMKFEIENVDLTFKAKKKASNASMNSVDLFDSDMVLDRRNTTEHTPDML